MTDINAGTKDNAMQAQRRPCAGYVAQHFRFAATGDGRVATITLNRPEKKNPLTFESYCELKELFVALRQASDVRAVVLTGEAGNFCSGGDVFEIIEPLTRMTAPELLAFTRMTGELIKAIRVAPQPVIAAVDGVCTGAGAMLALAADIRLGTERAKTAFLFTRVGLAGADMGACGLLPRMIGQGRATELLLTGRTMTAHEGAAWGFYNALYSPDSVLAEAQALARSLADGPWFAHGITKTMLNQEMAMGLDQMLEAEAQAQALCMMTGDFTRAFDAFAAKRKPDFMGN